MKKALLTWLGKADVKALTEPNPSDPGPLKQVIAEKGFNVIFLLSDWHKETTNQCVSVLKKWNKRLQIEVFQYELFNPIDYELVLQHTQEALQSILPRIEDFEDGLTFFATPGTPIMVAVLCLMAERLPNVSLVQSSKESGVKYVSWSIPDFLTQKAIKKMEEGASTEILNSKLFSNLVFSSGIMWKKADQVQRYAKYDVPVLLLGETGTGKEVFARRIHEASERPGAFIPVNCGAIPASLIESLLFGTTEGAYTGATNQKGKFELADHGTIFLDEIGELPLEQQVKLLRVIQEKTVTRLGPKNKPQKVDIRIVAATHRNLQQMVAEGTFREDLFYRLAIAVITLPPLRDRGQDIYVAADNALKSANELVFGKRKKEYKKFSEETKLFISTRRWPGNFRELNSVVLRAVINASNEIITAQDIQEAMLGWGTKSRKTDDGFELPQYTSDGTFNLKDALGEVEKYYIQLALKDAGGIVKKASDLLGITNYQTLSNRMTKYKL